ncbi:MAG: hypothetical protein IAG10_02470 [Planctomycetaceae bacterium]|nr:hypothetical protein [Planctomycetaceae bacterium]
MRVYSLRTVPLRTVLCLTLAALATSTAFAGVRGKSTKPNQPAPTGRRLAQSDSDYIGVNSQPVPLPPDVNITNERVIHERAVNPAATLGSDPNCDPAALRSTTAYAPMPMMMVMPMMAQPVMQMQPPMPMSMPMPMMAGPSCSTCGGGGYAGLSPEASAAYNQAFGPGLYRTGAEVGQYHYPYYSYRRPWYFPGQPSFHRSTDYVW